MRGPRPSVGRVNRDHGSGGPGAFGYARSGTLNEGQNYHNSYSNPNRIYTSIDVITCHSNSTPSHMYTVRIELGAVRLELDSESTKHSGLKGQCDVWIYKVSYYISLNHSCFSELKMQKRGYTTTSSKSSFVRLCFFFSVTMHFIKHHVVRNGTWRLCNSRSYNQSNLI